MQTLSENECAQLCKENPQVLLSHLKNMDVSIHTLTFGAEIAGELLPTVMVVDTLLALLSHPNAVVREGAVYGLSHHTDVEEVQTALLMMTSSNFGPSLGVRMAAKDALPILEA